MKTRLRPKKGGKRTAFFSEREESFSSISELESESESESELLYLCRRIWRLRLDVEDR